MRLSHVLAVLFSVSSCSRHALTVRGYHSADAGRDLAVDSTTAAPADAALAQFADAATDAIDSPIVGADARADSATDASPDSPLDEAIVVIDASRDFASDVRDGRDSAPCLWAGFAPQVNYPTGYTSQSMSIATGDFDRDGHVDFAVASSRLNTISVYFNNGDGSFGNRIDNAPFASAHSISVGDFNGDDYPDILATGYPPSLGLFINRRDGTFAPSDPYPSDSLSPLALGDFNGDHALDLAIGGPRDAGVALWLNDGTGRFASPLPQVADVNAGSLTAGDFDGDGHLDIAVVDSGSQALSIWLNDGSGAFRFHASYGMGGCSGPVVVGDFDGDGRLDLATATCYPSSLSLLFNQGMGTFAAPVTYPGPVTDAGVTFNLWAMVAADFDGDGHLDIAAANASDLTGGALVWFNVGGNGRTWNPVHYPTGWDPADITAGDFNGDGHPDLAVLNYASNTVSVMLSQCRE